MNDDSVDEIWHLWIIMSSNNERQPQRYGHMTSLRWRKRDKPSHTYCLSDLKLENPVQPGKQTQTQGQFHKSLSSLEHNLSRCIKQIQSSVFEQQFVSAMTWILSEGLKHQNFTNSYLLFFLFLSHLELKPYRYTVNNLRQVKLESGFHSNSQRVQ